MTISPLPGSPSMFLVTSDSGEPPYSVDLDFNGSPACDCKGFTMKKTTVCRHIRFCQEFQAAMIMSKNEIKWTPVSDPPDDETTVLLAVTGASEPVWLGYHDANGHGWSYVDATAVEADEGGDPNGAKVTHWAHLPEAP